MKKLWITVIAASLMIFSAAWGQQTTLFDDRPKITVNGEAVVNVKPDKIVINGVNYIHGIDFQTTEFKKYREQARELALKAAKEKAEKMAAVLGQSVGAPIQISESYSGSPWWYWSSWSGWGYGRNQSMAQNVIENVPGDSGEISETVALGKISIRAAVTVTFELKK